MFAYVCVCMYVCMCICTYVRRYVCDYVCLYVFFIDVFVQICFLRMCMFVNVNVYFKSRYLQACTCVHGCVYAWLCRHFCLGLSV